MCAHAAAVAGWPEPRVAMSIVVNMASSSDDADGLDVRPTLRQVSRACTAEAGAIPLLLELRRENKDPAHALCQAASKLTGGMVMTCPSGPM